VERCKDGFIREALAGCGFGDAEVNDFGYGCAIVYGNEDVRGFEIAVDDAFLVRVLDGLADLDEKFKARSGR
jgi:hypothetical protein